MKPEELQTVLGRVEALWRNQSFKHEELVAWRRTLTPYALDAVLEVLDTFARDGKRFIPDLPELHEALRSHSRREARQWPLKPDEPEAKWEDAPGWLDHLRQRLGVAP